MGTVQLDAPGTSGASVSAKKVALKRTKVRIV
jgi:hypothetical protein